MIRRIKSNPYSIDIIISGIVLLIYLWLQPTKPVLHENWETDLYRLALREHFWEYISYTPLKPPLFSVLHASVLALANFLGISEEIAIRTYVIAINVAVAPLLYRASINFRANVIISALVSILASLALLPLVSSPLNYDFPAYFFMALFLFSASHVLKYKGGRGLIYLSFASGLLIAQSTVQILTVPLVVITIAITMVTRENLWALTKKFLIVSIFPALVTSVILVKNFLAIGLIANSSLGGHALMLVVMGINHWDIPKVRENVVKSGAPDWYIWCFDNPGNIENGPHPAFLITMGHCFDDKTNLKPLKAQMERLNAAPQAALIERDITRYQEKPYLLAGISPDMSTEWFAAYSKISAKVSSYFFKEHPMRWINNSKYIHGNLFSKFKYDYILSDYFEKNNSAFQNNPKIIKSIAKASQIVRFWAYHLIPYVWLILALMVSARILTWGMARQNQSPRIQLIASGIYLLLVVVGLLFMSKYYFDWFYYGLERKFYMRPAYGVVTIYLALMAFIFFTIRTKSKDIIFKYFNGFWPFDSIVVVILILQISVLGFVYCSIVGTENNRFFFQLTPYLFVLSSVLLSFVSRSFDRLLRVASRWKT